MIERIYRNHAGEIIKVWEASVRATHHFLAEGDIEYYKKLIPQLLEPVRLYCIRENGEMAAFMGVSDDNLEVLFVRPESFLRGYGKRLIEFAVHSLDIHKVDVNEENLQAFEFYKKMGYKVTGRSEVDSENKSYPMLHMEYMHK